MSRKEITKKQLQYVLKETHLEFLGKRSDGKVRESYVLDNIRYLVATDRLSCFDVVLTHIPFKGQVLTQLAADWFGKTKDIIANHLIEVPDPNVMVVKECSVVPVEVVVRGYLAGSAWRDYKSGKKISGVQLPADMKMSQKLEKPILTPATKAEKGDHDQPISEAEIISKGIVEKKVWEEISEVALALFELGTKEAKKQGLILVDTKYEFGLNGEQLTLVDEIHTLDSSRYWRAKSYQERFDADKDQEMLDKEPVRQWLLSQGYQGEGEPPAFTEDYILEIAEHYISSYEEITGQTFDPIAGDTHARIKENLEEHAASLTSEKIENSPNIG